MREASRGAVRSVDRGTCGLSIELRKTVQRERRRCQTKRKATRTGAETRAPGRLPGVRDLRHARKLMAREPGDPGSALRVEKSGGPEGEPARARSSCTLPGSRTTA